MEKGFSTHTTDINGEVIRLGDVVGYDFEGSTSSFIVVFEGNAFRKQYKGWDKSLEKPILEYGQQAINMRLVIIKKESQ